MASSNAGTNASNASVEKPTQPVESLTPDVVTNVPTANMQAAVFGNVQPLSSPLLKPQTLTSPTELTNEVPVQAVKTPTIPAPTPQLSASVPRATSLPSAASEASVKNRASREEKSRKKDDKSVDHVLRALNSLNTTEEKLAAMCKKYADIFDEHRKLQLVHKQTEKRCSMLQREKEQLQGDQSKAILTRSRLENLCRELQRQNKAIKDESLLKIREEEEKRKEVSAKFQLTMNEITTLMQQNNDKNMKLREDNVDMTTKLKNICEQYETRQQQVERISKQMQLEQQLAEAKLAKLKLEMSAERETLLKEKQKLLLELQQYQQRCTEFQATEVNLRSQISMYNEKYDEFQKALARSNDVFGGFKGEMEKMSKKITKLEKETASWKQRWERSHTALLEMAADKQRSEQELATVSRQLTTLQGLCRTLQAERTTLLSNLKTFQGSRPEPSEKSAVCQVSLDKCTKQCEQSLHAASNHVVSESDGHVLNNYSQDILASLKESVKTDNALASDAVQMVGSVENSGPLPINSLPDVVEAANTCALDQKTVLNSTTCLRLGDTRLSSSEPSNQDIISVTESSVPVIQESSIVEQSCANTPMSQPSVIVENLIPQPVTNGESHLNGSTFVEQNQNDPLLNMTQAQPPKSPTAKGSPGSPAKSTDSGKKTKESAKKKKK